MASYVITPQTDIFLLKCPLEMDSRHQINFGSANAQHTYFASLPKAEMDNATYQRKDDRLYFEGSFDTYLTYNYCMYQNEGFSNKWFYAFVTDMRYESNNSCSCRLVTDVFQTWMFDFTLKASFIERSHVAKNTDTVGAYTYPEGLETGEYKVYDHMADSTTIPDCVILATTIDYSSSTTSNIIRYNAMYNGLISGCGYYRFDSNELNALALAIKAHADLGQSDSIVCLFMYPKAMAPYLDSSVDRKVAPSSTPSGKDYGISRISALDGYTPNNKKLLTYPYCYIVLSNGIGTANIYRQEVWSLDNNSGHTTYGEMVVHADAVLCPSGSIRIYPVNYNGTQHNFDEGFTLGKFPQLSYPVDLYTNWEVQNGINIFGTTLTATESGLIGNALMGGANLLTGNPVEAAGALGGIFSTMKQQYQHSLLPTTLGGNLNSADVSAINGAMAFQFQRCGIRQEYARKIDDYFEMFGYKLCSVAVPNITSRSNWNYIKTVDVNMVGDIPEDDMQRLKDLFNGGFTIWHTTAYFLDYTRTNS